MPKRGGPDNWEIVSRRGNLKTWKKKTLKAQVIKGEQVPTRRKIVG